MWDIDGNIKFKLRKPYLITDYADWGLDVHFSPEERYVASISFHRNKIDIWDMKKGKLYDEINHEFFT